MVATVAELSFLDERRRRAVGQEQGNQFVAEKFVNAVRVRMPRQRS
jgi:hypothetical protein